MDTILYLFFPCFSPVFAQEALPPGKGGGGAKIGNAIILPLLLIPLIIKKLTEGKEVYQPTQFLRKSL